MVTTITKTVGATGRDYSTIAAAEADIITILSDAGHGTDMVSDDVAIIFELYIDGAGSSQTFAEAVTVDAAVTTDATRNITFRAAEADRHDGTRESGVRVKPSAGGHTFLIKLNHTRLENLELVCGSGSSDECVRVSVDEVGVVIDGCLMEPNSVASPGASQNAVYFGNWSVGSATDPIVIQNCYMGGFDHFAVLSQIYNGTGQTHYVNLINCTFELCDGGYGYRTSSATQTLNIKVINCVAIDCVSFDFGIETTHSGTLTTTGSANNSGENDTTGQKFPANTQRDATDNLSPGAGDWMIFADATGATVDLREALLVNDSDNDAQGAGVGPASNSLVPEHDCLGNMRTGTTTDVGWNNVTATVGITLTPDAADTQAGAPDPSLDIPRTLLPDAASVAAGAPAPDLDIPRTVSPLPAAATLGTPDPLLDGPAAAVNLAPDPAFVTLSAPTAPAHRILRPDPASAPVVAPAPDLDTPRQLNPLPAVTELTNPAVSVGVGGAPISLSPDPAEVALGVPAAKVNRVLSPDPAIVALDAPVVTSDTPRLLQPQPASVLLSAPAVGTGGLVLSPDPAVVALVARPPLLEVPGRRILEARCAICEERVGEGQIANQVECEGALTQTVG